MIFSFSAKKIALTRLRLQLTWSSSCAVARDDSGERRLAAQRAAVAAGQLVLRFSGDEAAAFAVLRAHVENGEEAEVAAGTSAAEHWQSAARLVLAALANRLGDLELAQEMVATIKNPSADEWLELLTDLSEHPPSDTDRDKWFAGWLVGLAKDERLASIARQPSTSSRWLTS